MEMCFGEKLKPFLRVSRKVEPWSSSDWAQLQKGFRGNLEGGDRPPGAEVLILMPWQPERIISTPIVYRSNGTHNHYQSVS